MQYTSQCVLTLSVATFPRWMPAKQVVKSSSAFALCATASAVAVGCAEGIIRLFDPSNLTFKVSLPRPPPLGCANQGLRCVCVSAVVSLRDNTFGPPRR